MAIKVPTIIKVPNPVAPIAEVPTPEVLTPEVTNRDILEAIQKIAKALAVK